MDRQSRPAICRRTARVGHEVKFHSLERTWRFSEMLCYPRPSHNLFRSERASSHAGFNRICLTQIRDRDLGGDLMDRQPKSSRESGSFHRLLAPPSIRAQSQRRIGKFVLGVAHMSNRSRSIFERLRACLATHAGIVRAHDLRLKPHLLTYGQPRFCQQ
jgi:hypothetical protein